jgi:hypothetical protein
MQAKFARNAQFGVGIVTQQGEVISIAEIYLKLPHPLVPLIL